ncbi:LacI family DNA-binding transcriptional regulator [Saccharothrix syringae]|uniref:LacI family transcriptional regulator n=1 Tax=Saccharothrix syringae TaxID=103733 RepID=A0A5Q0H4T1_SACSY|nr:LacI family DNA-binding transcriptional regulator [Saccharothrix syringae]QFZ20895.1 LacI family transcriptional regulator [Saccharothrix syringae]
MTRPRVTLADVAAASGVSVATVSLVLSGRAKELRISARVERRVRATAEELGYRRRTLPAGSRAGGPPAMGFVSDAVASSEIPGDLIRGAVEAAHRHGFVLFVGESGGDPDLERTLVTSMHDRQVGGIVFATGYPRRVLLPEVLNAAPFVLLNVLPIGRAPVNAVLPDDVEAGRAAARVLVDAGHRDGIHLIGTGPTPNDIPRNYPAAVERLTGACEAFREAGVEVVGVHPCLKWMPEDGYRATRALLAHHRPKALLCFSDRLAFGAYRALGEAGLSVPDDVSVVGIDNQSIASWMHPRLTTVALPHYQLGSTAVELLLDLTRRRTRGNGPATVHRVAMPTVYGGSVRTVEAT